MIYLNNLGKSKIIHSNFVFGKSKVSKKEVLLK